MDVPWAGAAFRRTSYSENEIELVILVTPEFCEALDATEVPPCGPGELSAPPTDVELYYRGYLEVPKACDNGNGPHGHGPIGGSGYDQLPAPGKAGGQSARKPVPVTPSNYPALRTAETPRTAAIGTGTTTGRTVSTSTSRTSPTSGSKTKTAPTKPSAGGKPALIGPLGYDELR